MSVLAKPTKKTWREAIYSAMSAQKIYKAHNQEQIIKAKEPVKCAICKDNEYVWSEKYKAMIPCKCHAVRNMERRLRKAGISIEEYQKRSIRNFPEDRPEAKKMKELALRFIAERQQGESIIYTGKSGTMKTSICMAICLEMTMRYGQNHKYFSYRDEMPLLKWLMFNKADEYQEKIKELINCDNLFIDDLFKNKKSAADTRKNKVELEATSADTQIMFQLVNGRYLNRKTTLFSTEYRLSQIVNDVDEATGTRIYEMCKKYNMACSDINRRLMRC